MLLLIEDNSNTGRIVEVVFRSIDKNMDEILIELYFLRSCLQMFLTQMRSLFAQNLDVFGK